jgi:hypothetical protein
MIGYMDFSAESTELPRSRAPTRLLQRGTARPDREQHLSAHVHDSTKTWDFP